MSHQQGRAVSEILIRYFGEIVQQVGDDLFKSGCKPIGAIVRSTGLTRAQVLDSLRTLLKFDLACFEPAANEVTANYKILPDNVLLLIRYPRYLLHIKTKYGSEAELIIEELQQSGLNTATKLLVTIANKYKEDKDKNITILSLRDMFISLATAALIQQAAVAEWRDGAEMPILVPLATIDKNITILSLRDMFISLATAALIQQAAVAEWRDGAEMPILVPVATIVPDLDVRGLAVAMTDDIMRDNDKVYWKVNYDRFHQDFRDDVIVQAMTRRIDDNAGELTRALLSQMYLHSSPWAPSSNPIPIADVKQSYRRSSHEPFLDHYLRVLEENGCGIIRKCGEAGGGQVVVHLQRAAVECMFTVLEHTVTERHGDKAARIFRLIRAKKYIEEEDIQKHAMLPNKECKELTYKLLEEHFISVHPMRKAGTGGGGMVKAIYLYHINVFEVAQTALQMCYRSLHNVLCRARQERDLSRRLRDKQRRVASIVHGMRLRAEPQENIDDVEETITPPERLLLAGVEKRLKQLSTAELQLDRALFLIDWYNMYRHH